MGAGTSTSWTRATIASRSSRTPGPSSPRGAASASGTGGSSTPPVSPWMGAGTSSSRITTTTASRSSRVRRGTEPSRRAPPGAPDPVAWTVTENARTLKFVSHGCEGGGCLRAEGIFAKGPSPSCLRDGQRGEGDLGTLLFPHCPRRSRRSMNIPRAIGLLAGLASARMLALCVRRGSRAVGLVILMAVWTGGSPAWASLADVLKEPQFNHLSLAPIAPALAATVASTYPVASASSGVVYVYNTALDTLERQTGVAGPIIGERAETIGKGEFSLAASYSYVQLTSINGDDLDSLLNRPPANGKELIFRFPHGVKLADGRLATFLPVRVVADLDLQAHILAPSVTYGITNDLEVNARLPLLRTSLDVTAHTQVPDPRVREFALPPSSPNAQVG